MTNVIKFQSPFERLKDNNQSPEIALLKAIILQSIIDATNISTFGEARRDELDAKAWIYGGSEDFKMMCEYVSYSVDYVRKIARKIERLHKQNSLIEKQNISKKLNKAMNYKFVEKKSVYYNISK
jgi:hypothetical protein